MSRVTNLLAKARVILADPNSTRYSDTSLLYHVNSGINNFLSSTKVSKSKLFVFLETGISTYKIQDFSQSIESIRRNDKLLPVKTVSEMDAMDPTWLSTEGTELKYAILEGLPLGTFILYPRITAGVSSVVSSNQPYGTLIDIDVTEELAVIPGDTNLEAIPDYVVVTYIKKQPTITISTADEDLVLDGFYDDAILYYTTGMALRNDADTQNRAFGNEQITIYGTYVKEAKVRESLNNNTMSPRTTEYRGFE